MIFLPPTKMQRKVERFIHKFRRANDGVSPTYAEIAEGMSEEEGKEMDVRNAYHYVTGLVERGRATRTRNQRSIQLLTTEEGGRA